jgi:protein-S-isoprenylcysteine O-methyltransferase Ste14
MLKNIFKQLFSLILPITVLILIPLGIEKKIRIGSIWTFIPGILLIIVGLTVMIITILSFIRIGKGTLAPWSPPKKLITGGFYRYVRNPMISGVLITLFGETLSIMSYNLFIWTISFFIINNIYFLLYEEPSLKRRFGQEYLDYKMHVPRWIPRLSPYNSESSSTNQ